MAPIQQQITSFLDFCRFISENGNDMWNINVTIENINGKERRIIFAEKSNEKNWYICAIVGHGPYYFSVCVEEFNKGTPVNQPIDYTCWITETCEMYEILYHPDKEFYEYRFQSSVPIYL